MEFSLKCQTWVKTEDFDPALWMLFCQELSMYVSVESISGGPWKRMEGIINKHQHSDYVGYDFKKSDKSYLARLFSNDFLRDFTAYYLMNGHLSIGYVGRKFVCGLPFYDFIIDISNSFIDFYNNHSGEPPYPLSTLMNHRVISMAVASNGCFYLPSGAAYDFSSYQGQHVLTFKGKDIRLSIVKQNDISTGCLLYLLDIHTAMFMLRNILQTINFRFQNEQRNNSNETPSSASQRVLYV